MSSNKDLYDAINDTNAKKKLIDLLERNFDKTDYYITFVYNEEDKPKNKADAIKDVKNTFRRIKRLYKQLNKPLKYIWIMKHDTKNGLYFRFFMSKGIIPDILQQIIGKGQIFVKPMDYFFPALVYYELSGAPLLYRRWSCSKNLEREIIRKQPLLPTE